MSKNTEHLKFIEEYFEDEKSRNPGRNNDWLPEENLKNKIMQSNQVQEFLETLKAIIVERNDLDFARQMLWFVKLFLDINFFLFETEILYLLNNSELIKFVIKHLKHNFIGDHSDDFERLTLDERREYLKKLDQIEGIPTKLKEFKKLVKARIEKFGHDQLPRLENTREFAKA